MEMADGITEKVLVQLLIECVVNKDMKLRNFHSLKVETAMILSMIGIVIYDRHNFSYSLGHSRKKHFLVAFNE